MLVVRGEGAYFKAIKWENLKEVHGIWASKNVRTIHIEIDVVGFLR